MNSIKIKTYLIISAIFIFSFLVYSQHQDGPSFTNPKPPSCFISSNDHTNTGKLCAASACAMIMKYWATHKVVDTKSCKYWGELFADFWGTGGGATAPQMRRALSAIAKKHKLGEHMFISSYMEVNKDEYSTLKKLITYSNENMERIPWDIPGVLAIGTDKNNSKKKYNKHTQNKHAVTVWGCKKNSKGNIFLKFIDTENKDAVKFKFSRFKQWIAITEESPYCVFVFLKVYRCE